MTAVTICSDFGAPKTKWSTILALFSPRPSKDKLVVKAELH